MAIFDFESICVEDEISNYTETTTWIGKHNPISVSISSTLIHKPIFLCDPNPRELVSSCIDALEILVRQSKAQIKMNFLQIETAIKSRLASIQESINQRRSHCVGIEAEDDISKNSSTQFLKTQKNQLIDLQEHFERYCNTIPVS